MKAYVGIIILGVFVLLALLAYMVTYTVSSTEMTLVTRFGKVDADRVYDGRDPSQAGLKFKWPRPAETLYRYDARTQVFENALSEIGTKDGAQITVTMFCQWRIVDPVLFHTSVSTVEVAEAQLRERLESVQNHLIGQHNMDELINTDPARMKLHVIEEQVAQRLRTDLTDVYGVDIVMVGFRTLGLPESTSKTVLQAMSDERQAEIKSYRARGSSLAQAIRSRARSAQDTILAFAQLKAENIRTEGYRQSAQRYQQYAANPEFAMFLRSLESLREELTNQTVILLDGSKIPAVKFFKDGPSVGPSLPTQP
jgi:modulator of FtsH protease HflC